MSNLSEVYYQQYEQVNLKGNSLLTEFLALSNCERDSLLFAL